MTQPTAFQSFLNEFQINPAPAAGEDEIKNLEVELGFALPEPLRDCYRRQDGGTAEHKRSAVQLLSLGAAAEYRQMAGFDQVYWQYYPLAENNDSNPVCVCCKPPLTGYVVLVSHDDEPRLLYRTLDGFFDGAVKLLRSDSEFFDTYHLTGDFDGPERTVEDRDIARQLIELANFEDELEDQDRTDALRFACDLLGGDDTEELAALLDDDDEYVRGHVLARLQRDECAAANELLRRFEREYDAFLDRSVAVLQNNQIDANRVQNSIRIDPWPIWLNMDVFYSERRRPDFDEFLLERAKTFIAQES